MSVSGKVFRGRTTPVLKGRRARLHLQQHSRIGNVYVLALLLLCCIGASTYEMVRAAAIEQTDVSTRLKVITNKEAYCCCLFNTKYI